MALKALELIDPYVLAVQAYDDHDQKKTMYFISECDGKFAKWGWNLWGIVLSDEKNFDSAIENYKKAINLDPKFASAYFNLGIALTIKTSPDYDGAIESFKKAIDCDPNDASAYNNLGVALIRNSAPDYDGAIKSFKKAIDLDPNHAHAYESLGDALTNKPAPDYEGAIENYGKAMRINPEDSDANSRLENAISEEGLPRDAAAKFMQTIKSEPNDWVGHYIFGLLEIKAGDTKSGISELRRADRLRPGNQFIQAALHEDSK